MRKQLFIILSFYIFLNFSAFAQDWKLIVPPNRYNYKINNESVISTTIWVDSIKSLPNGDTKYFLNKIFTDCDTCELLFNNISRFAFYNQPQFLQNEVIISDTSYNFILPNNYVLYPLESEGFTWVFDTINSIDASITLKTDSLIFNTIDSIKIICLSTQDTVIISKNYGILQWDDINSDSRYNLIGINNFIGDSVPDFFDFYDFNVGDIFEYIGRYWTVAYGRYSFREKVFINSKTIHHDTVIYNVYIMEYRLEDCEYEPCSEPYTSHYNDMWIFENSPNQPTNRYNNELIQYSVVLGIDPESYYGPDYTYLKCYKDSIDIFTKSIGSFQNCDFMSIYDTSQYILERHSYYGGFSAVELRYKVGLGTVYYDSQGFEYLSQKELVAYIKDNDTVGEITDDSFFSYIPETNSINSILVYPNPAKDNIYIINQNGQPIDEISINGINGNKVKTITNSNSISIVGLKPSIYIIEILSNKVLYRQKIIVIN